MNRIHLFEFHDLAWFPQVWRDFLTEIMAFFESNFNPFKPVIPMLAESMRKTGAGKIIDLCSGSARTTLRIQKHFEQIGDDSVEIILTDKFPNLLVFREISQASSGKIKFMETPVDATKVPEHLSGFRTMFTSFHHFPPETAKKILEDAVRKNEGIGIFEYTEKSLVWLVSLLVLPLALWVFLPFIKHFRWQRILWTVMLLPGICGVWDGLVSCLRTYSLAELKQLTDEIKAEHYHWEMGRVHAFGGCYITYLLGYPSSGAEQLGADLDYGIQKKKFTEKKGFGVRPQKQN
jgi:hypothetical protein